MVIIRQLKLPVTHENGELKKEIARRLRISIEDIVSYQIQKQSVDARKKPQLYYSYAVVVTLSADAERKVRKRMERDKDIASYTPVEFKMPSGGEESLEHPPVIVGMGPAGLFCGLLLARAGFSPIILERGSQVEKRQKDVDRFWNEGTLLPDSNVQFGEGGAGTFSDGKLNTLTKDKTGRNAFVLKTLVEYGAPEQILWDAKPHIGTDILRQVVVNIREEIRRLGGQILFDTTFLDYRTKGQKISGICYQSKKDAGIVEWDTSVLVLALGHSARDTFGMLHQKGIRMSGKEFAVGFRVEHPQSLIQKSQYGEVLADVMAPAPYKVATKLRTGRGVYSFCMCPGGYVVNASSVDGYLAVNGMSYAKRDGLNANSAIVVSVGASEYSLEDPMGAIAYQMQLEKKAYELAKGRIPQQLYGDFCRGKKSTSYGAYSSETKGEAALTDLSGLFSESINTSFKEGMELFGRQIQGFDGEEVILSGVESRTSSPIRIHRDESFMSNVEGIYPCGEGAGYAGGITSAAMDGMKIAEEIIKRYQVNYES